MPKIEEKERINEYTRRYPDSRATTETLSRISQKGVDYLSYSIGDPIVMESEQYATLNRQAKAYIRICEKLCQAYSESKDFKRLVSCLVLQFESDSISDLVEKYPIATLSGIRFGTDAMLNEKQEYKTMEVNLGPAGGPAEVIKIESIQGSDYRFPISDKEYTSHFIHSLDAFYQKACLVMGIKPTPLIERHLVIVENDEWTPGNFIFLDLLRSRGINAHIAPKEALVFDKINNTLNLRVGSEQKKVDQLILYFHLQEDTQGGRRESPGDLVKALASHAVVVESSPLPLIVLASKSIMALISQMAEGSEALVNRLGIDKTDLEHIKGMFPKTYHWRGRFFKEMDSAGYSRMELLSYLEQRKLIIKSARTNLFAGMGVFGADNKKGRKGYQDFLGNLSEEVYRIISENSTTNVLFERLIDDRFVTCLIKTHLVANEEGMQQIIEGLRVNQFNHDLDVLTYGIDDGTVKNVYEKFRNPVFPNSIEVKRFIDDFAKLLSNNINVDLVANAIICYISTFMLLPFVLQEKITPLTASELRVSGFVGETVFDVTSMISTLKRAEKEGDLRPLHVIMPS